MNDLEFDKTLKQQLEQLPRSLQPSRDLWAGIDHAIEQQQQRQHSQRFSAQRWSAVAAGVAVFGLSMWLSFNGNISPDGQGQIAHLPYITQLSDVFEQQKQILLAKYEGQPAMADNWRSQLKTLDEAASAIKKALDQEPSNPQLIKMLQQTYQQQLDLIKAVNQSPWQTI